MDVVECEQSLFCSKIPQWKTEGRTQNNMSVCTWYAKPRAVSSAGVCHARSHAHFPYGSSSKRETARCLCMSLQDCFGYGCFVSDKCNKHLRSCFVQYMFNPETGEWKHRKHQVILFRCVFLFWVCLILLLPGMSVCLSVFLSVYLSSFVFVCLFLSFYLFSNRLSNFLQYL